MLGTIIIVTLITLVIVAPVVALAVCKVTKEFKGEDKILEHPERIRIREDK